MIQILLIHEYKFQITFKILKIKNYSKIKNKLFPSFVPPSILFSQQNPPSIQASISGFKFPSQETLSIKLSPAAIYVVQINYEVHFKNV